MSHSADKRHATQIRLWAKENYEKKKEIYKKNGFRVEQNWFGDRDCVKDFHTASLYVLARFALSSSFHFSSVLGGWVFSLFSLFAYIFLKQTHELRHKTLP